MKKSTLQSWIGICLLVTALGCGERPADSQLPDSLPDMLVPVDQNAGEVTPANQDQAVEQVPDLPNEFTLTENATLLGLLDSKNYNIHQKKWVGSIYPACNFFLITALCESGYCKKNKPFFRASEFDIYLMSAGFEKVTIEELRNLYMSNRKFDVVYQKDNPVKEKPGHVMVGIGYDSDKDRFKVAQGNLDVVTNEIKDVKASYLTGWQGGFNLFVRM